ncbi:DUF3618 domain-containing protein [Sphingomonas sp.]|uniref:DUF3618 domain-containing protein n=1 Tax=Sphingomonas sp. TaxID=28214 RepID=UPI003B00B6F9
MVEISETDRIERDLARTRARMDDRLDELQDHLTPKQMINDAFGYFRGGEGADFTKDLVTRARANPIPVALTGIGIAWLMASSQSTHAVPHGSGPRRRPTTTGSDDLETRLRVAEGSVQRLDHDDDDSYASRLDDARGKVVGVTRHASDTAASYGQRIKDAIAAAAQSVREKSHDLTAGAHNAFDKLGDGAAQHGAALQGDSQAMARSARDAFSSVTGNPFALGAVAALVGLVAGSLIPTTEEEESALGSAATRLRTAGRDLAQDVVDRGGRAATETLGAIKDSAQSHGLNADRPVGELLGEAKSGDLVGNIKQVAQETLQAGKDSAQTQFAKEPKQGGDLRKG